MEFVTGVAISGPYSNGTLADATPLVVTMGAHRLPTTVTLDSADGARLIEISTDGGTNYFTPTYDATTVPMINVVIMAPVTNVRFTGAANDTWSVR